MREKRPGERVRRVAIGVLPNNFGRISVKFMNLLGLVRVPILLNHIVFTLVTLAIALTHPHVDKIMVVFLQIQNDFQVRRTDERILILG